MKQIVTNYTIIIDQEKRTGTNKTCYTALVPILGIATEADTLEQAQKDIQSLVQFHLESLAKESEPIPVETTPSLVTRFEAKLPENAILASS